MGLSETVLNPQIGMLAVVRNRQGIVSDVQDHDGASGLYYRNYVRAISGNKEDQDEFGA